MKRKPLGCWTCRIRHKKCDEAVPKCHECSSREIPCHGYGQKPEWVDDQELVKAELGKIKKIINQNFRRLRKLQQSRSSSLRIDALGLEARGRSLADQDDDEMGVSDQIRASKHKYGASDLPTEVSFREAELLMHYLDYIFPLQYPYYKDNPKFGGRGWVFWLLMKRGPLHHAVLTLSALHYHTELEPTSTDRESELITYHTTALQRLRGVITESDLDMLAGDSQQLVEFLACGASLISFELFRGGIDNWEPHLYALISVVNRVSPSSISSQDTDLDGLVLAQRFLITKVVWLDVLASTGTGKAPKSNYHEWLDIVEIETCTSDVFGYQNWIMKAIGDLSAMFSDEELAKGDPDPVRLNEIKALILEGMDMGTPPGLQPRQINEDVTRVFSTATLVQLHTGLLRISSTEKDLHDAVSDVIAAIRQLPSTMSVRGLAWPISIAGSMAAPDQQPFFDELLMSDLEKYGDTFTNCGTVLKVVRRCWEGRKEQPGEVWTWRDGMTDLGICALLV